jgi:hypothetical protein
MTFEQLLAKPKGSNSTQSQGAVGSRCPAANLTVTARSRAGGAHNEARYRPPPIAFCSIGKPPVVRPPQVPQCFFLLRRQPATKDLHENFRTSAGGAVRPRFYLCSGRRRCTVCMVALGAYFAARGESCPQNSDKTGLDDDKVVVALFAVRIAARHRPDHSAAHAGAGQLRTSRPRMIAKCRSAAAIPHWRKQRARPSGQRQAAQYPGRPNRGRDRQGKPHARTSIAAWHGELVKRDKPITQGGARR